MNKLDETTAYHGSPYDFDNFNIKFIGQGEGHQVHGYGLYFALTKKTGKNYYKTMSYHDDPDTSIVYKNKIYDIKSVQGLLLKNILKGREQFIKAINVLINDKNWLKKHNDSLPKLNKLLYIAQHIDEDKIKQIRKQIKFVKGQFYKVELPDLDYFIIEDRDLNFQSNYVKNALQNKKLPKNWNEKPDMNTAKKLNNFGIAGIKYNGRQDGLCIVLFNDKDVKIIKKLNNKSGDDIVNNRLINFNYLQGDEDILDKDVKHPTKDIKALVKIKQNPYSISEIENPSEEVQMVAINQSPYSIQHIKNPTEDVKKAAVEKNGDVIKYIKNPSEEIQLAAIRENPYSIRYIENPTEKVQLEAVKKEGWMIENIKNPSEKVQMAAIKYHSYALQYIQNPSEKVQLYAIKLNPQTIQYISNPTEKVQLEAVKADGNNIRYLFHNHIKPTDEIIKTAILNSQFGSAIKFVENPSEEIQLFAIERSLYNLQYIPNPSEAVQLKAVSMMGTVIKVFSNPSEAVQLEAIKQDPLAYHYIKQPTPKAKELYNQLKEE